MFCSQCGGPVKPEAVFCVSCGTRTEPADMGRHRPKPPYTQGSGYRPPQAHQPARYPTHMPSRRPKHNVTQTIILTVCTTLIVLAAGAGVMLVLQNSNNHYGGAGSGMAVTTTPPPASEGQPPTSQQTEEPQQDAEQNQNTQDNSPGTQNQEEQNQNNESPSDAPNSNTEIEPGQSERFPFPGEISGRSGSIADILFLQNTLNTVRTYYTSVRPIVSANGTFGGDTQGAVIDFQQRTQIRVTGIVDETTWYRIMDVFENPPPEPDPPFTPETNTEYITLVNLHLRDTPSQQGYSLGVIPEGTIVWVMDYIYQDRWFYVTTLDGEAGFMKAEFLLIDGAMP